MIPPSGFVAALATPVACGFPLAVAGVTVRLPPSSRIGSRQVKPAEIKEHMARSGDVISVSESYKTISSPMRPTKMKAMVASEALLLGELEPARPP